MAELTNSQKKEYAGVLYLRENLTQQEIAEKVGVSRRTVGKWIADGKWEELKAGITMTREQQIMNLQRQIAEVNRVIGERPVGERYATTTEAATMRNCQLRLTNWRKMTGLKDLVSAGTAFGVAAGCRYQQGKGVR